MKKAYESPMVEQVKFQYRDQVVAASGTDCINQYINEGTDGKCQNSQQIHNYLG